MTPTTAAAGTREAQARPGRGRNPLVERDRDFGAILSDVVQGETPGSTAPAECNGTSASPASAAARKLATSVAVPLEVEALLARLAEPAVKSLATATASPAQAPRKQEDKPKSGDAPDVHDEPDVADGRAASPDPSVMLPVAPAAQVAAPLVETADAERAPAMVVARLAPQVSANVADTQPPRGGDAAAASQMEAEDAPAGAYAGSAGRAVMQGVASGQVALVEVASHLTPTPSAAGAASRDVPGPAPATVDETNPAKARAAAAAKPIEATSPGQDAGDGRADHDAVVAPPTLAADATEAAGSHPIRQIADAVAALAADTPRAEIATGPSAPARPSPTRSLILHLAPASLGAITVRLHLNGDGLSVRLAVENPATLGLISHSREALQAAIGTAYALHQLVIHGAETAPTPKADSHDSTRNDGGQLADQGSSGRRGNEEAPRPSRPAPPREARAPGAGRADGLFL